MKLLLLTARVDLQTNRRIAEAAAVRGVDLEILDGTRVVAAFGDRAALWQGSDNLLEPAPTALLARVGNWRPESLLAVVEAASACGVPTPNPAEAIRVGRDHWRTVEALHAAGIPVPETAADADPEVLAEAAVRLGWPVVVKLRRSRMGVGVIRCTTRDHLESVLDSLWRIGDEIVVQRFIGDAGSSLRLLVVGRRVVAAARFEAAEGEWRSNGARGGRAALHRVSEAECRLAIDSARAVGLGICGVDLLVDGGRTVVCEVNPTPGFVRLEQATGVDVAALMVDHVIGLAPST